MNRIEGITNRVARPEQYANPELGQTITGNMYPLDRLVDAIHPYIKDKIQEHFFVVALDNSYQIKSIRMTNIGTTDEVLVYVHDIFRDAILDSARTLVLVHNHPGQKLPLPTQMDVDLTGMLVDAGTILDIGIEDHIVITSDGKWFSFVQEEIMPEPLTEDDLFDAIELLASGGAESAETPGFDPAYC